MDRRAFIGSFALGTLATLDVARAQPARKVYRIGILVGSGTASDMQGPKPQAKGISSLLRGLRELGWVYGEHFVTEARTGEGKLDRLPDLAAELVRLKVDVFVGTGPVLPALKQATSTIPVVMVGAAAPVGQGLVQSLARPGTNFTGLSLQLTETTGKRLELLKGLAPGPAPVAFLWDRHGAAGAAPWEAAQSAARQGGWRLISLEIRAFAGEIEMAFAAASDARAGALLVHPNPLFEENRGKIIELAVRRRLPAIYGLVIYVGRRADVLQCRHLRHLLPRGGLRGQDLEGDKARRPARRAADEVRPGCQRRGRQGDRADASAVAAHSRERRGAVGSRDRNSEDHAGVELHAAADQGLAALTLGR
jgi:putative ABC transport system substrate-binding protein